MSRTAASPQPYQVLVADDDRPTRFAIATLLREAGYAVKEAEDGAQALGKIAGGKFDVVFLDIWMPNSSGLEVLSGIKCMKSPPKVFVMTSDDTPQTLLGAVREQAYEYVNKPFPPKDAVEMAARALRDRAAAAIDVVSAQPHWVELLIPCTREAAERVQGFLAKLDAGLPADVRDSIGMAFRELVLNAVEWGGQLDPNRKVRIACVRTERTIIYRIADPGKGFDPRSLPHAAIGQPEGDPTAHLAVREQKGIRPGGFGIMMTRQLADELVYNEARNEVIFVKYIAQRP